jgi:NAD(P)-dependent dehydrogenase (short-subunit alcohol dehydrogenase family)
MSNDKKQQPQPVAIVTGAATGIGAAIAHALQAAGHRVFGTYRKPPTRPTPGVEYVACDVTNDLAVDAAVRQVMAKRRSHRSAGQQCGSRVDRRCGRVFARTGQFLFDVNLFGVIRMTKAVLPSMRQQGTGRIVTSARCWA